MGLRNERCIVGLIHHIVCMNYLFTSTSINIMNAANVVHADCLNIMLIDEIASLYITFTLHVLHIA